MQRIMAIDPGKTTGIAILDYKTGCNPMAMDEPTDMLTLSTECHLWYGIEDLIIEHDPDIVVYESFRLYSHKAKQKINSEMPTSKVIGVIAFLTEQRGLDNYRQSAQIGKGFYDRDRLEGLGFTDLGSDHRRDSLKHALHYISFNSGKTDPNYKDRDLAY